VLISNGAGEAVAYALGPLEERGILFVGVGEPLYEGMIIGENAKPDDLEVNPMKSKQLTNFRSTGKDDAIRLTPPKIMTLEQARSPISTTTKWSKSPSQVDPRLRKALGSMPMTVPTSARSRASPLHTATHACMASAPTSFAMPGGGTVS
jgi:GTP-binding protein